LRVNTAQQVLIGTTTVPTGGTTAKVIIDNGTTAGALQIKDGTQGANKVLTSDANGMAKWAEQVNTFAGVTWVVSSRVATSATLPIKWGTPTTITGIGYDNNTGLITIQKSGYYMVTARVNGNPETLTMVDFMKSGEINEQIATWNGTKTVDYLQGVIYMTAGEKYYFKFRESHGACTGCGQSVSVVLTYQ